MTEVESIDAVLRQAGLPKEVVDWQVELGLDWTDEPAVYIWLIIDDAAWSREWSRQNAGRVASIAREAIHAAEIDRWPYVRIRPAAEHHELQEMEPP